ncbi:hypothetical protein FQA39_LY07105 [Lamprigera yunnana]|nr:hypothetical protein FQA39_LY07105 [Lamprigera yunnana]
MVRHNNMIPNGHFHKKYKQYIKTWFNQPMKKKRRALIRKKKAIQSLPRPVQRLRPEVHCPTLRYNAKTKIGRGFTLEELQAAGLKKDYAMSVGIAVDTTRHNKSVEGKLINVQRLKTYMNKLIVFPILKKKGVKKEHDLTSVFVKNINKLRPQKINVEARVPTKTEKAFSAYGMLKKCRKEVKTAGLKLKRDQKIDNLDLLPEKKDGDTEERNYDKKDLCDDYELDYMINEESETDICVTCRKTELWFRCISCGHWVDKDCSGAENYVYDLC